MKKVGIVTIHKINNYGAVLQAYALNRYIRGLGHDAKTIDFRTYRVAESYKLFRPVENRMDLVRNGQALLFAGKLHRRKARFDQFLAEQVPMTSDAYYSNGELRSARFDFDTYICGSDQIWNTHCRNYDDAFILEFARGRGARISYAASLGAENIHPDMQERFHRELSDYKAVSVREKDAVDIIAPLSGGDVTHVCDPVLLLTADQWKEVAAGQLMKEPYIFFYHVKGDIPGMRDYLRNLSKKTGMKVVAVTMNLREMLYPNVKSYDAGPREFLSLSEPADYVVTNSFHATAFSLIFRKKMMVFAPHGAGPSRLTSVLETAGLMDRVWDKGCAPIEAEIDYDRAWERLAPFVEEGKRFLQKNLED